MSSISDDDPSFQNEDDEPQPKHLQSYEEIPNKLIFVPKKGKKKSRGKIKSKKLKDRLKNSQAIGTNRKNNDPQIASTPKLSSLYHESGSIKDLRSNVNKDGIPSVKSKKYNKITRIYQSPVTVDKFGNKIGFGTDLNYYTMQNFQKNILPRNGLNSRGTVL